MGKLIHLRAGTAFRRMLLGATAALTALTMTATAASASPAVKPAAGQPSVTITQLREIKELVGSPTFKRDQALFRRERAKLAHMSTQQVEQLLAKAIVVHRSDTRRGGPDGLGYSRTGDTIWLNMTEVVVWSVASVAAIIGVLIFLGVPGATADVMVGSIVATLVGAAFLARCAWITYDKPRSWGNYGC
jgi:hypothetical protein